jgi:hypothetical protein
VDAERFWTERSYSPSLRAAQTNKASTPTTLIRAPIDEMMSAALDISARGSSRLWTGT